MKETFPKNFCGFQFKDAPVRCENCELIRTLIEISLYFSLSLIISTYLPLFLLISLKSLGSSEEIKVIMPTVFVMSAQQRFILIAKSRQSWTRHLFNKSTVLLSNNFGSFDNPVLKLFEVSGLLCFDVLKVSWFLLDSNLNEVVCNGTEIFDGPQDGWLRLLRVVKKMNSIWSNVMAVLK